MASYLEEVAALTVATTALLSAVNVKKLTLDAAVQEATDQANLAKDYADAEVLLAQAQADLAAARASAANISAGLAAGSAAQALAIYGTTNAMNASLASAATQANAAAASAASASSVVQQDLSAISQALHRSPNAIVAMAVYDTSKDSDGGAWVERMQHTSWVNETLSGAWLSGGFAGEAAARGDNVQPYPEDLSSAAFRKNSLTVSSDTTLAPDGTMTADTLTGTGSGSSNFDIYPTDYGVANSQSTFSLHVLGGTATEVTLKIVPSGQNVRFNISTGAVIGTPTVSAWTSVALAGGGFRFSATSTKTNPSSYWLMSLNNDAVTTATAIVWGVKFNYGGTPTTYVANSTQAGQYYQLTTDGKFYKLNATYGATEVFRGSKGKFPRLAAIVAEANALVIYDLTVPGCPMWMRFTGSANNAVRTTISAIVMLNGTLCVAHGSASGASVINFASDNAFVVTPSPVAPDANIAARNTRPAYATVTTGAHYLIGNSVVNGLAMTVMPDAPIDPTSGLRVPTIAFATNSGVTLAKHDGTAVNSSTTSARHYVTLKPSILCISKSTDSVWEYVLSPGNAAAAFAYSSISASAAPDYARGGSASSGLVQLGRGLHARRANTDLVALMRMNEGAQTTGLAAIICNSHTTGWLVGDIRRAYLAAINAEAVGPATELVTNGDFSAGTAGWATSTAYASTAAVVSGEFQVTATSASGRQVSAFSCTVGKSYFFTAQHRRVSGAVSSSTVGVTASSLGATPILSFLTTSASLVTVTGVFTATAATHYIFAGAASATGDVYGYDNISVNEVNWDRSYKSAVASIFGTLTKTAVATGAQLVAYSGWSPANYMQEIYSADLDFALGDGYASAWVNYSTAVASTIFERAAATGPSLKLGTDGGGKFVATVYDGTTTRTATTPNTYNTGAYVRVAASYKAGKVAIEVNGLEVASTNGTLLLTLSNAAATLTLGNNRALTEPFPGHITLLKIGATVPTAPQAAWTYEQERAMFRDNAQVTLPANTTTTDLTYDAVQDKWVVAQAAFESSFTGLVRTASAAPSAGSFTKVAADSGVKLLARSTTTPGVDVTVPAYGLREELRRGAEAALRSQPLVVFDDVDTISFTATTTNTSNQLAAIASVVGTPYIGMGITGTGIPANTTITGINGTTYTISANATASGTTIAMGQSTFTLPAGWTATEVLSAGASKREGATKDFVRLHSGFRETIRFAVSPGGATWVQIARKKE